MEISRAALLIHYPGPPSKYLSEEGLGLMFDRRTIKTMNGSIIIDRRPWSTTWLLPQCLYHKA